MYTHRIYDILQYTWITKTELLPVNIQMRNRECRWFNPMLTEIQIYLLQSLYTLEQIGHIYLSLSNRFVISNPL